MEITSGSGGRRCKGQPTAVQHGTLLRTAKCIARPEAAVHPAAAAPGPPEFVGPHGLEPMQMLMLMRPRTWSAWKYTFSCSADSPSNMSAHSLEPYLRVQFWKAPTCSRTYSVKPVLLRPGAREERRQEGGVALCAAACRRVRCVVASCTTRNKYRTAQRMHVSTRSK